MQVITRNSKLISRNGSRSGKWGCSTLKRAFSALLSLVLLITASPAVFAAGEAFFHNKRLKPGFP